MKTENETRKKEIEQKTHKIDLENLVKHESWKIPLGLNYEFGDIASKDVMNKGYETNKEILREKLGDRFNEVVDVVSYANSMLMDFESSLKYYLEENRTNNLFSLQENALLYGRSKVVKKIDEYGRKNGLTDLIISKNDYQRFLANHALPQIRVIRPDEKEIFFLDMEQYEAIISDLKMPEQKALSNALGLLENSGNDNIPRKFLLASMKKDNVLIAKYQRELITRLKYPRRNVDQIALERVVITGEGTIKKLQEGDSNRMFPLSSSIYLVNGEEKTVWKENIRLYTDFSRLDGYNGEKEILQNINHPNIIKLKRTFVEQGIEFLELEHAKGNTLNKTKNIRELESLDIAINLCDALDYLHSKNIVYLDMKAKNVVYDRLSAVQDGSVKGNLKLIDFGMAQQTEKLENDTTFTTLLSTPKYLTPELTEFLAYKSTDTFQMGVLLYEMLYNKHPFKADEFNFKEGDNYRDSEILTYGLAVRFGQFKKNNDCYDSLFTEIFEKNPLKRPDVVYVKNELQKRYDSILEQKREQSVPVKNSVENIAMKDVKNNIEVKI